MRATYRTLVFCEEKSGSCLWYLFHNCAFSRLLGPILCGGPVLKLFHTDHGTDDDIFYCEGSSRLDFCTLLTGEWGGYRCFESIVVPSPSGLNSQ
jgi:hypothetical protein